MDVDGHIVASRGPDRLTADIEGYSLAGQRQDLSIAKAALHLARISSTSVPEVDSNGIPKRGDAARAIECLLCGTDAPTSVSPDAPRLPVARRLQTGPISSLALGAAGGSRHPAGEGTSHEGSADSRPDLGQLAARQAAQQREERARAAADRLAAMSAAVMSGVAASRDRSRERQPSGGPDPMAL